jgi:hypothetical protein
VPAHVHDAAHRGRVTPPPPAVPPHPPCDTVGGGDWRRLARASSPPAWRLPWPPTRPLRAETSRVLLPIRRVRPAAAARDTGSPTPHPRMCGPSPARLRAPGSPRVPSLALRHRNRCGRNGSTAPCNG